jgi:hypothetical protein
MKIIVWNFTVEKTLVNGIKDRVQVKQKEVYREIDYQNISTVLLMV